MFHSIKMRFSIFFIHQLSKIPGFTSFLPGFDTALDTYSNYPLQQYVRPGVKLAGLALAKEAGIINSGYASAVAASTLTNTAINAVSNYLAPRYNRQAFTPRTTTRWTTTPSFNRSQSKFSRKMPLRRSRYGARRRRFGSRRMIRPRGAQRGRLQYGGKYRRAQPAMLAPELKFHDTSHGTGIATSITGGTNWFVLAPSLNLIARGTGQSQRNGRKCILKSIDLRVHGIRNPYSSTTNPLDVGCSMKVLLVLDQQANGAAPTPYGTLASGLGVIESVADGAEVTDWHQLATKNRYRILKTFTITIPHVMAGIDAGNFYFASGMKTAVHTFHKKLNLPIEFSGGSEATAPNPEVITNVRSNNLSLIAVGKSQNLNNMTDKLRIAAHARIRFIG